MKRIARGSSDVLAEMTGTDAVRPQEHRSDGCTEPLGIGIYPGIPEPEYRGDPATGHSDIRHWLRPKNINRTAAIVGTGTHTLWMEGPTALRDRFVCTKQNPDLRTIEGKERAAELVGDSGKELLRGKEWDLVTRCVAALQESREATAILKAGGENELTVIGKFPDFEQLYKCRIDLQRRASIWDIKTTSYVNEQQFRDAEVEYGYINQLEFYAALYAAVTGKWLPPGCICVSKREPHNVWLRYPHDISNQLMAMATKWRVDMLTLYERYVPAEMRAAAREHATKRRSLNGETTEGTNHDSP